MIFKLLLIIAIIAIVYFMFIKKTPTVGREKKASKKETPKTNDMVECASCGVYVDIDEAILSGTEYYCSNECLREKV